MILVSVTNLHGKRDAYRINSVCLPRKPNRDDEKDPMLKDRVSVHGMRIDDQDNSLYVESGFGSYGGSNRRDTMNSREFFRYYEYLAAYGRTVSRLRSAKARLINPLFVNRSGPKFCLENYLDCRKWSVTNIRHGRIWTFLPHNSPAVEESSQNPQIFEVFQHALGGDSGGPLMKCQAHRKESKAKRWYITGIIARGDLQNYLFKSYTDVESSVEKVPMMYEPFTCKISTQIIRIWPIHQLSPNTLNYRA